MRGDRLLKVIEWCRRRKEERDREEAEELLDGEAE
jgi:hypothetical protein